MTKKKKVFLIVSAVVIFLFLITLGPNPVRTVRNIGKIKYIVDLLTGEREEEDISVEELIEAFVDKSNPPIYREYAASKLGHSRKDPKAVEPLIGVLQDRTEDERIRKKAAFALGLIGDKRAINVLIRVMLEDESNEIRFAAIGALSRMPEIPKNVDDRAITYLINMLKGNRGSKQLAIAALEKFRDPSSVEYLTPFLKDSDMFIRKDTAKSLGEIKDKRAFNPLKEAFADEKEDDWVKPEIAIALAKLGDNQSFEYLLNELKCPIEHSNPAEIIIRGLGEIGNPKAIEPLLNTYELTKEETICFYPHINVLIGRSLIMLGSPKGVPILENHLEYYDLYVMEIAQDTLDNKEKWLGQQR